VKSILTGCLIIFLLSICLGENAGTKCNPFQLALSSPEGKKQKIILNNTSLAVVYVFLLPDCPACQDYSLTLNKLASKYKTIQFIGVMPGSYCTVEELKTFLKKYHISFPVYIDNNKALSKCLNALIVPEVFFISRENNLLYSGRIDDWMYSLSKKKPKATTHELADALESFVQHKPIKVKKTKAVGCFIE